MAYTAEYSAEDISAITIDGVAKFGIAFIAFISLVALVVLFVWFRKRVPGLGK